ncbi:MAG TPA: YceI family protein [Chitinophagales bacterium]|nr:YceI family protein [Chitinophagales bacterium]
MTTTTNKTQWKADTAHSEVGFKVKHMMITNVRGKFEDYSVSVKTDGEDFSTAEVNFSAKTASINTGSEDRDKHLRSADFFESEKYPEMKFVSTQIEKMDEGDFVLTGDLTIRDITKSVKLDVEFGGILKDPYGNNKAGFIVTGKIYRKDWGLNWNAALEAGGVLVAEDVKLNIEIQFIKSNA